MTTYTIVSYQPCDTYYDRCSGSSNTEPGTLLQRWFTDRDKAVEYWADRKLFDTFTRPNEDNTESFEDYLYIDGKSTHVSWENLSDDNNEYNRLDELERDFERDVDEIYYAKKAEFLAEQERKRLEEIEAKKEREAAAQRERELRKRESDLATLARLKEEYEGKQKGS